MPGLLEILTQEELTLEDLLYQLLLREATEMRASATERPRITNRPRNRDPDR